MIKRIYERLFGIQEDMSNGITDTGRLRQIEQKLDDLEAMAALADESERRNRELVARYEMVFKHVKESILIVNADTGKIVDFNDSAATSLGYTRDEFGQLDISDIDALDTQEDILKRCKEITDCGCLIFDTKHQKKTGDVVNVECYSSVIRSNGATLLQTICRYQEE